MQPITSNNWVLLFTNHTLLSCTKKTRSGTLQVIILITGWIKPTSFRAGLSLLIWLKLVFLLLVPVLHSSSWHWKDWTVYDSWIYFFSCIIENIPEIQKKKRPKLHHRDHVEHIFTQIYLDATYAFHIHPIHVHFMPQPLQAKIKQAPLQLQQKQNL